MTTPERTLVDACGLSSPWSVERAVDDALRRRLMTLPRLVRCSEEVPVSGRRPSKVLREILAERLPEFHPGESPAELDVMKVLAAAGIPLPVPQYRVRVERQVHRLDFAWPDTLHALEYDSSEHHANESSFHGDRERMRRLQRADWTVWPLTSRTSPHEIVAIGMVATQQPGT